MTSPESDNLESLLGSALRGRLERVPSFDLAAAAITRAHALEANEIRLARVARLTRWTRLATIAAAFLIAAVLAIGYMRFPVSADTDTATAVTATATTTTSVDLTTIGLAAFLITLIAVVLMALFTPERPQLRLSAA